MPTASSDPTVMANQGKSSSSDPKGKKDYSTAILERKKSPNRLEVNEATNDDNSIVTLHPDTVEHLQLFRSAQILSKFQRGLKHPLVHGPTPMYGPSEAPSQPTE